MFTAVNMKVIAYALTVGIILVQAHSPGQSQKEWYDDLQKAWNTVLDIARYNATFNQLLTEHIQEFGQVPSQQEMRPPFDCDLPRSPSVPTSAHQVRPGDIKVIASIGDSIAAGYAITAEIIVSALRNDRHLSWASGGFRSLDEDITTLVNIVRKFNPGVKGYSYDESWPDDFEAGLNVGVGAAIASEMKEQADHLFEKMRRPEYRVNWENDWKLINFMIGANDLCSYCWDEDYYSPENFERHVRETLDFLYAAGPPNTIVVVSNIFDVTPLPAFSDSIICDIVQAFVCSCYDERETLQALQQNYARVVRDLINSGRYDRPGREDFTVIMAPHFDNSQPPKYPGTDDVDRSFWAVDCFHPGRKAHFAFATSLWNQLFEAEGQRHTALDWQMGTNLYCPTESAPYIRTRLN